MKHTTPIRPQTPKLRIPPPSQLAYNTQQSKTNNMQQQNMTLTPTNTHHWQHITQDRQNPQHNTQTSNIPHNITQDVQSQIPIIFF
jgi:hypothetical protein